MKAITIRFPDELAATLSDEAWQQRTSVNKYVVQAVQERVQADQTTPAKRTASK